MANRDNEGECLVGIRRRARFRLWVHVIAFALFYVLLQVFVSGEAERFIATYYISLIFLLAAYAVLVWFTSSSAISLVFSDGTLTYRRGWSVLCVPVERISHLTLHSNELAPHDQTASRYTFEAIIQHRSGKVVVSDLVGDEVKGIRILFHKIASAEPRIECDFTSKEFEPVVVSNSSE